jgi:hypothetical protein
VAPPRERLVGDPDPALRARSASSRSCAAASASSSIACGETFEHTSTVSAPSSSITANFASARRRLAAKRSVGTASKSRSGW